MIIKYKIIELVPDQHSIVVRFWTDKITEDSLCTVRYPDGTPVLTAEGAPGRCSTDMTIAINKVPPPTGAELERYILRHAPREAFERQERVMNPEVDTSLSSLSSLVGREASILQPF